MQWTNWSAAADKKAKDDAKGRRELRTPRRNRQRRMKWLKRGEPAARAERESSSAEGLLKEKGPEDRSYGAAFLGKAR